MIDCKAYASEILNGIKDRVSKGETYGNLAVISVGYNPASESYMKGKKKDCEYVGFGFHHFSFTEQVTTEYLVQFVRDLTVQNKFMYENGKPLTGVILQLPVPKHINAEEVVRAIPRSLDVDGFKPESDFNPCTPEAVMYILRKELGDFTGKSVLLIGRGQLVGKPLLQMLIDADMTVIQAHSKSKPEDIKMFGFYCDAVISAIGKPWKYEIDFCTDKGVIIDCGISRGADGKLHGDIYPNCCDRQTPVPNGVGLMTRAMLVQHCEKVVLDNG